MNRMKPKPELLAPAGSFDSMRAAVAAGADAVYMGGTRFGARAYAQNPDHAGILEAIDYLHFYQKKLYLTVNTLLKDKELEGELYHYLLPLYQQGLDAVIVQDYGVLSFIKRNFPNLSLHASTQMTVGSFYGARILQEMGVCRLVMPRELSLDEIQRIHQETDLELEGFIHGALCYGYSGQCLLSSMIGGRSGNRGRCAQPCRLPYDHKNRMNLKDLCTLQILPQILEAGVSSLKIEGRMKSPLYTAGVVEIYRKYLDRYLDDPTASWMVDPMDEKQLLELFDRGGFTDGYYQRHNSPRMITLGDREPRIPNEDLRLRLEETYLKKEVLLPIEGRIILQTGKPARLEIFQGEKEIRVLGDTVEKASTRPLTNESVKKQMEKTGGSGYTWSKLEIILEEDAFLPLGALNRLRRQGLEQWTKERLHDHQRFN